MNDLYEFTKEDYICFIDDLENSAANGQLSPSYYSKNTKKKEYYEYVDPITRAGIINNNNKIEELSSRIDAIVGQLGLEY